MKKITSRTTVMKKVISLFAAFAVVFALPNCAFANSSMSGNYYIKTIRIPEGTKTVNAKDYSRIKEDFCLVFPDSVETLVGTFEGNEKLAKIVMNDNLTLKNTDCLFNDCSNLREITLPKTAPIGDYMFRGTKIVYAEIDDSVTSVGEGAFELCRELRSVKLPKNLKTIEAKTFSDCEELTDIEIPSGLTKIYAQAFSGCSLINPSLPKAVEFIGERAFEKCRSAFKGKLTLPENLKTVESSAFAGCINITEIIIPKGLSSLGKNIIKSSYTKNTAFQNVSFDDGKYSAGESLPNLKKITVNPQNKYYTSKSGVLFTKDGKNLILYPSAKTGNSYTVPKGTVTLTRGAFVGTKCLKTLRLSSTVKTIEPNVFGHCGIEKIFLTKSVKTIKKDTFTAYPTRGEKLTVFVPLNSTADKSKSLNSCIAANSDCLSKKIIGKTPKKVKTYKPSVKKNSVKLKWADDDYAAGYKVYIKKSGKFELVKKCADNSVTLNNLKANKTYVFKIRAYGYKSNSKDIVYGDFSKTVTVKL